jgi:hypothetical protein
MTDLVVAFRAAACMGAALAGVSALAAFATLGK